MKRKSNISNPEPAIGMGATIMHWSDREPVTIIQITHNGKRLVLQSDTATRLDNNGMSESQEYEYEPNPNGEIHFATKRKNGTFRLVGKDTLVSLGERRKYYDYSY
jgi:hypothetical protein